jgi:bacterioferritin (cytochrome b1)
MNLEFETHCPRLAKLLPPLIADDEQHALLLNSLSMMESVGARKIAAYVNPIHVDQITLQHAAEEMRHAYYLKRQIKKLGQNLPDYSPRNLLAPHASYRYLHRLDWACSHHLKSLGYTGRALKHGCYLLVTYLIEVRAMKLYHTYQDALTHAGSRVHVRSIIKEEEGHLNNMSEQLQAFDSNWHEHIKTLTPIEQKLFDGWVKHIYHAISNQSPQEMTWDAP